MYFYVLNSIQLRRIKCFRFIFRPCMIFFVKLNQLKHFTAIYAALNILENDSIFVMKFINAFICLFVSFVVLP